MTTEQRLSDIEKWRDEFIKSSREIMTQSQKNNELTLKSLEQGLKNSQLITKNQETFIEFLNGYEKTLKEMEIFNKQTIENVNNLTNHLVTLTAKIDILFEEITKLKNISK